MVSAALDWCSGTEICGGGFGELIPALAYTSYSTWGGALDKHPDMDAFVALLTRLHDNPDARRATAKRGMERARTWTWDAATDNTAMVIERIMSKRRAMPAAHMPLYVPQEPVSLPTMPAPGVDGAQPGPQMALVEVQR